ncbi:molybdopterin oxidoreductase family protein [Haloplanus sp. C73]|uniref:molybdopterin oxidoreductase family protein n=1 Tax=Haloplanus sp. C73 TaxID=3421641 RepID=UPI003EB9F033
MSDPEETVCPLCAVGCHLSPGQSARARGVASGANPAGRLCSKGVGAFDVVDDDERLTRPSIRRDGSLTPTTWETAYERVVEGFESVVDAHGADSLAFLGAPYCTNEENYLLQKLARLLGTNNVDNRARLCHASTTRTLSERLGRPATTNRLDGLTDADVIVVAGANPARRQPVAFNSFVRPAVDAGATLVHLDPVGNRTTRLADVHLAPRPETDALVFDLLSHRLLAAGAVDRQFVDERTRGFEMFERSFETFDPDAARTASGVDRETVAGVADRLAAADRVAALVGTGIETGSERPSAPAALLDLLLLTGNVGRPGTGVFVLRGLVNEQGATDVGCVPDRLPGHRPLSDADAVAAEWGADPPNSPGQTATELLASFGTEIRGALVVGENPAISKRDTDWVRRRLDALDTLVVVDIAASQTTQHADVVLAAASGVEKAGTVTNLDRRVQRVRPIRAPPAEARPDCRILRDVGRRLVSDEQFGYSDVSAVFDELSRVVPAYRGVDFDSLAEGGQRWPFEGDDVLYREAFDTPDGRAAFGTARAVFEPREHEGLHLVAGGRTSEFYGEEATGRTVRLHPADAAERGIEAAESIVVSNGEASIVATAAPDDTLRRGTAYAHASVADPLLRCGSAVVTVESTTPTQRLK